MTTDATEHAILAVWRIERARLIAALARIMQGDVGFAEELCQDALVAALERWPATGIPDNPSAWLMTAAKRKALDQLRRHRVRERVHDALVHDLEAEQNAMPDLDSALDDNIGDETLRMMFSACHPLLSPDVRVALTLRLVGGLQTKEIANAFLEPLDTVTKRIARAKKTLANAAKDEGPPDAAQLSQRLSSVLEVIYVIFSEGYAASRGDQWMRPQLCAEALRLGRMLAAIAPFEPEAHGLLALMEIQASRAPARHDANGEPVLLLDQDRRRWDQLLLRRGLQALARAEKLGGRGGYYVLQASIAACHGHAIHAGETDWKRIAALYAELAEMTQSPIVELNRAVAVSMCKGPEAGLAIVDALLDEPCLKDFHLLAAVRGDLLERVGRAEEAREAFKRAALLTRNLHERKIMTARAARLS